MNVLQVITRSEWGGAPRIVESLVTQIDDVSAVACGPGGQLIDRLENTDISVHVQPHLQSAPHPKDALAYRDIRDLLVEYDFDLVHCHSTKAGALTRIAASRTGTPSVFTVHGWGFYNSKYATIRPIITKGEQFLACQTDAIVCVSHNDYQEGQKKNILAEDEGTVIHNGIELPQVPADRNTVYDEFSIERGTPVIGAIARLAPQKNPTAILDVTRHLQARGHDFATVLIGDGPLASDCRSFVAEHNLENVYLPGFREDALELLMDLDIFLLPSRFEGFPLTVLECLHTGVPIVARDVGGVAEAIDNGVTGYVVSPEETTGAFADRVEVLLSDRSRRERMRRRGQQVAAAKFTEERMIDQYRRLYRSILEQR